MNVGKFLLQGYRIDKEILQFQQGQGTLQKGGGLCPLCPMVPTPL